MDNRIHVIKIIANMEKNLIEPVTADNLAVKSEFNNIMTDIMLHSYY